MGISFADSYNTHGLVGVFYRRNAHHWSSAKTAIAPLAAVYELYDFTDIR